MSFSQFRDNSGTSPNYNGDSYQNIIGDIIVVQAGYMISWLFLSLGVGWRSAELFLILEIWSILSMRDSLLLNQNVYLKNKEIMDWQSYGVTIAKDRKEKNLFFLCPPSAFLAWLALLAVPVWMGLVWMRKYIHSKLISKKNSCLPKSMETICDV